MKKIKVLHYYTQYNLGGTEKVIYSILNGLNKNIFDCYFLSTKKGTNDYELEKIGIKVLKIDSNMRFEDSISNIFCKYNFDIIHVHNCHEMNLVLKIAKKHEIKKRIAHSHVSRINANKIVLILKKIKSIPTEYYANRYYACSKNAAEWLFPTKNSKALILLNAVDKNKFKYNENERKLIRNQLNLNENDVLLIMISRLSSEKNHRFILEVLAKLLKNEEKYKLLIIGDGPTRKKLEFNVKEKNMEKNVYFLGRQENINQYLSAADIFLMPSKMEGLGIAAVEAQFNGIKTICSNNVPHDVDIDENIIEYVKLNQDEWVDVIRKISNRKCSHLTKISTNKFNIENIVSKIEEDYQND